MEIYRVDQAQLVDGESFRLINTIYFRSHSVINQILYSWCYGGDIILVIFKKSTKITDFKYYYEEDYYVSEK